MTTSRIQYQSHSPGCVCPPVFRSGKKVLLEFVTPPHNDDDVLEPNPRGNLSAKKSDEQTDDPIPTQPNQRCVFFLLLFHLNQIPFDLASCAYTHLISSCKRKKRGNVGREENRGNNGKRKTPPPALRRKMLFLVLVMHCKTPTPPLR